MSNFFLESCHIKKKAFCLGTGVPRHSAGGVGTFVRSFVCTYVVLIICNAHARVLEAENSITLTIYCSSESVFIVLGWCSENDYGLHEYTYQDPEYILRAMNTKHAQCTCCTSAGNQTLYIWVFLLQAARMIALCHSEHICDQVA